MARLRPVAEAENRLERFNQDRDSILRTVERRIVDARARAAAGGGDASLEYVINEVAYAEMRRLERADGRKHRRQYQRWRDVAGRLGDMDEREKRERLEELVRHYAVDVVGNFDPRVYRFANQVLPPALGLWFTPFSLSRPLGRVADRVRVEGPIDAIRAVCDRGTLVITPTHSSNMDSIVVGFALNQTGLPPATYGAGKNLFASRLLGFFMHNLGAYRVDRRLQFSLYKDVLKEYSTVLLEHGYHSLFFPGGTRSRSNQVESRLKLGLLGTAVRAYENNLLAGHDTRRIYIVPVTINYHLVLEAETLIDDFLAAEGKSRYIIEDDEFSRLGRVVEFLRRTLALQESLVIRFSAPLDPFGNPVDARGDSLDARGRAIDPASYLRGAGGEVTVDAQRDAQYTRELGDAICRCYRRDTVLLTTALVARALYDAVAETAGSRDVYRLLRLPPERRSVPVDEVCRRVDGLRALVRADPALGSLHERAAGLDARAVVDDALRALGAYHTRPVAERTGDAVHVRFMRLLYYYQNRTSHISAPREDGR